MKINPHSINPSLLTKQSVSQKTDSKQSSTAATPSTPEHVKNPAIATASLLDKANQALRSAAVVDADRVADIRQQLNDGRYQINPQNLANNIINHEKALQG